MGTDRQEWGEGERKRRREVRRERAVCREDCRKERKRKERRERRETGDDEASKAADKGGGQDMCPNDKREEMIEEKEGGVCYSQERDMETWRGERERHVLLHVQAGACVRV